MALGMKDSVVHHPDLYILRHGETVWNREGRFQGHADSPLTEKGRTQALRQRALLTAVGSAPEKRFCSPQGRAVQTAQLALDGAEPVIFDDRLKEIHFGSWEGRTREDIRSVIDCPFESGLWYFRSPGGETFGSISCRVRSFLADLSEPATVVTHGITSIVLRGLCLGLDQAGMLKLPKHQGCIFHLSAGKETILL